MPWMLERVLGGEVRLDGLFMGVIAPQDELHVFGALPHESGWIFGLVIAWDEGFVRSA